MTSDYGFANQNAYVRNCHSECQRRGCQYREAMSILRTAQQVLEQTREAQRMASEWCEIKTTELPDGHPFNGKKGKVILQRQIFHPDGTVDDSGSLTMCMTHGEGLEVFLPKGDDSADIVNGEITSGE